MSNTIKGRKSALEIVKLIVSIPLIQNKVNRIFFWRNSRIFLCPKALCSHGLAYIVVFFMIRVVFFTVKYFYLQHAIKMYHSTFKDTKILV